MLLHPMHLNKVFLLCLACTLQLALSQVVSPGSCPKNIKTQDVDVSRYVGRWYEYAKYPLIFEAFGKCIFAEYNQLPSGQVSVFNRQVDTLTGSIKNINGKAKLVGQGKLVVTFDSMPAFIGGADYWILGTDYENYAVIYSCFEVWQLFHTRVVWILTRNPSPSPEIIQTAEDIIKSNNLSLKPLNKTDQNGCNYN